MKINEIEKLPVVPAIGDLAVKQVELSDLEEKGVVRPTYGLDEGDTFEFPDSEADINIISRQVQKGSTASEMLLLGLKNGKPAYFSVANLRRRDHQFRPVHPVAESLHRLENDMLRVKAMLGKKIVAGELVKFSEAVFNNGVRTNELRERSVASLAYA